MAFLAPNALSFVQSSLSSYDGSLGPAATVSPFPWTIALLRLQNSGLIPSNTTAVGPGHNQTIS